MEGLSVNTKELTEILINMTRAKLPVLVKGQPAIGKTAITHQVAKKMEHDLMVMHPAVGDPTDLKGMPFKDGSMADFMPFGDLRKLIETDRPTICFIDDIGQSTFSMQGGLMQLIHARQVNGHRISDTVVFHGATNDMSHKAAVNGIIEPLKSRFASIVELKPDLEAWIHGFAIPQEMPSSLIGFLRFKPSLFADFKPTRELTNSPSPRTWEAVGRMVKAGIQNQCLIAGAVGEGAALEYSTHIRLADELPDLREIIANPKKGFVPKDPALLYTVASGLSCLATKENLKNIMVYADRLDKEYKIFMGRDIASKSDELAMSPEIYDLLSKEKEYL
jgi:hypothetical protein